MMRANINLEMGEFKLALKDYAAAAAHGSSDKENLSEEISDQLYSMLKMNLTRLEVSIVGHSCSFSSRGKEIPENLSKLFFNESMKSFLEIYFIPAHKIKLAYDEVIELFKEFLPQGDIGQVEGDFEVALIKAALELAVDFDPHNEEALELLNQFLPRQGGMMTFPKA